MKRVRALRPCFSRFEQKMRNALTGLDPNVAEITINEAVAGLPPYHVSHPVQIWVENLTLKLTWPGTFV